MKRKDSTGLFNSIAPIYALFFSYQKRRYAKTLASMQRFLTYETILDVGCGTGALCSALSERGLSVTGVDPAEEMLAVARRKNFGNECTFIKADATQELPFTDRQFDVVIASYVAHGMKQEMRTNLYRQMGRVAKQYVIIHDYNASRSPLTSLVEYLEGGDYFHFIKHAQKELQDCVTELQHCFSKVEVVQVGKRANWYICTPQR
ncbi:MAG: class I SAM-dependent methyltransferase [Sphaerochaeta associata]|uniref:class I SAM-dependent methyltransferase n=1 Tax=Sphaerochaeta associata TaxID=1129264 RepID=UPI002B1F358A|nr:class I SAM-dependent methyltransferase [Sphaerochaeta associata]MEA5106836.1 class I SAM-dependent methyltransferase [Sphaerochaeta associata]